jgi:MFS transporter, OFA family, oxalate/formate antiporter
MDTSRRARLARALPFYYGWVVFSIVLGTSYTSRPLMSVAVLSVFVVPMTEAFGWSRGLFSGAVSLGGVCAVLISPYVGRLVDKYGAGVMIGATSAVAGLCAMGLALVRQAWGFYALYVPGRMVFASPLELATSTALSNWFLRRRALVLALFSVSQGTGLAAMPMAAQWLITMSGWQIAWTTLGLYTLAAGILPALVLMARRPEDMGLELDPAPPRSEPIAISRPAASSMNAAPPATTEQHFTLQQAMQTRAFWVLSGFSAAGFMAQAGVSLHHVSHYINNGLPRPSAAIMASVFAFAQVPIGLMWSGLTRDIPVRRALALAGLFVSLGAAGTAFSASVWHGVISASFLGMGVGGLHLLLRLAWADYYGRHHLGTIRGITLPIQIGGQAIGPVTAGAVYDYTGSYLPAFVFFAGVVAISSLFVLAAVPPHAEPVGSKAPVHPVA